MALWLGAVLLGTGIAGLRGKLPGCEPAPYIIRFTEDKPNPLYRRVCYTFAWGAVISYAVLNTTGLAVATATGTWMMKQIYQYAYFPLVGCPYGYGLSASCRACSRQPKVRADERLQHPRVGGPSQRRPTRVGPALGVPAKKSHHQRHQAGGVSRDPGVHGEAGRILDAFRVRRRSVPGQLAVSD